MKKQFLDKTDRQTIEAFITASLKYQRYFAMAWLQILNALFLSVLVPYATSNILAGLVSDQQDIRPYVYLLIVSSIAGVLLNRVTFTGIMRLVARVSADLTKTAYEMLQKRSMGFHANQIGGKLISDTLDYPRSYMILNNTFFIDLLPFLTTVIIGTTIVLIQSFVLGLIVLSMSLLVFGWAWYQSRSRQPYRKQRHDAMRKTVAHIGDSISNIVTTKSFGKENDEFKTHAALSKKLQNYRERDWVFVATDGSNRIAALLAVQVIFIAYIIYLTRKDPSKLAIGIFAFSYTITLMNKLFQVNTIIRNTEEGLLEAAPMTKYLAQQIEVTDAPDATQLTVSNGAITLNEVNFQYEDNTQNDNVFSNLSLDIQPGQRIGLVGPSGGGKTTLMKLLLRFEDINGGQILIDGQDISKVTQKSLRQNIGYVAQEPLLFHRTIKENIAYGTTKSVSDEEITQAAKKAHAYEFISTLPEGFNTVVGERGVKLSGGQRQRIAIARAILKNAPILLLDEATSALDSESEKYIQDALHELMKNKTVLVIAHRLSTINELDKIVVIDGGEIVEQGTHATLKKAKGMYAKLWNHQTGGFLEE